MQINNKVKISAPLLISLVITVFSSWLIFKLIDQSVTLDHQKQYTDILIRQRNLLVQVINATSIGDSKSNVLKLLQKYAADSMFDKGDGEVVASQVSFFFHDDRLIRIDVGNNKK